MRWEATLNSTDQRIYYLLWGVLLGMWKQLNNGSGGSFPKFEKIPYCQFELRNYKFITKSLCYKRYFMWCFFQNSFCLHKNEAVPVGTGMVYVNMHTSVTMSFLLPLGVTRAWKLQSLYITAVHKQYSDWLSLHYRFKTDIQIGA